MLGREHPRALPDHARAGRRGDRLRARACRTWSSTRTSCSLIFLPPLLYGAAFFTSLRDLRRNARPIALLAIGVVLATMGAVAVVAHEVIGLGWPEAFVLGAIVSPTDAVAPAEILRRLGRAAAAADVIEGESLTNDGRRWSLYKVAVAAVVTGTFSFCGRRPASSSPTALGGIAIGLAVGWLITEVRRRMDDPPTEITISLLPATPPTCPPRSWASPA